MAAKKRRSKRDSSSRRLGIDDWLRAARDELIENGILSVKVDRLARRLKVTRGSFYWHFESHADLLEKLLASWMATNTAPFERALESGKDPREKFQTIVDLWISEDEYSPGLDTAVREWARVSTEVTSLVRRADKVRIKVLDSIFRELGYSRVEAHVRARIAYFHQVGYYALGFAESNSVRDRLRPYYTNALIGD